MKERITKNIVKYAVYACFVFFLASLFLPVLGENANASVTEEKCLSKTASD